MAGEDRFASRDITHVQQLHLELLRARGRYNNFDGEAVVRDLLDWRDLWIAAMGERLALPLPKEMGKEDEATVDLCRLRWLRRNVWAVDSLLILTTEDRAKRLMSLIEQRWRADEMEVIDRDEANWSMGLQLKDDEVVLYLWWD